MPDVIKFSEKANLKLLDALFQPMSKKWNTSLINWLIDSKYRQYKRLDKFLKEQLDKPDEMLLKKAEEFKKYKYDQRIVEILKFVNKTVSYMHDNKNFGKNEYWATAIETLKRKNDDCDGINGLLYVLARLSGIPSFMMYCAIGKTFHGGHFWTVYLSTKYGKLYTIDGTYYVDLRAIPGRAVFRFSDKKYQTIWYLFNDDFIFKEK
ncbi:transglutaminase-like domain-containing protein [Candidatus Woesearchaeota archaeon]|nr:transglutaminase-like domain-containing protein [Candidatus Woesearchaeota archaeon]